VRRHGGRPDEISLVIDALGDLEDLHVMIMDVIAIKATAANSIY